MNELEREWHELAAELAERPWEEFCDLLERADALTRGDMLRARFRYDRANFLKWCFPEVFYLPWNDYHLWVLSRPKRGWREGVGHERGGSRPSVRMAVAAPRGIAKTTLTKGELVHDIVYGLEGYIVVMSAGMQLARGITSHLRSLFKQRGSPLEELYGPFGVSGGVDQFAVQVRANRPVGVLAKSFATEIRGANDEAVRPTKIVIDDGEKRLEVNNPDQRAKWWAYLLEDVAKAGPKEGGLAVEMRGTILHPDSILARLQKHPGWRSRKWRAMVAWPERMDLWERCGRFWADLTLGEHREACAKAFYEANRAEMDRGAEVLDQVAEPLFQLFTLIWSEGLRSFLKEKQNEATDSTAQFFDSSKFARCRVEGDVVVAADGRRVKLQDLRKVLFLDPIPGKELGQLGESSGAAEGDLAAIAVLGRDALGYGFLLDVWMRRCRDSDMLAVSFALAERWSVERAFIESVGFQRLVTRDFRRLRQEREKAGEFFQLDVQGVSVSMRKEDRIARLDAPLSNGWLQLNETIGPDVTSQFDEFPNAAHDDAPDAVEGAWSHSGGSPPRMQEQRLT